MFFAFRPFYLSLSFAHPERTKGRLHLAVATLYFFKNNPTKTLTIGQCVNSLLRSENSPPAIRRLNDSIHPPLFGPLVQMTL